LALAMSAAPAVASAQAAAEGDPSDAPPPTEPVRVDGGEMVIYAVELAKQARDELIRDAKALGYAEVHEKDGRTILRHELPWKGEIAVFDDGRVEFKRQPMQFEPPFKKKTPAAYLVCIWLPACIRPGGQLVSPRRLHGYEREVWAELSDDIDTLNARIADVAVDRKVDDLPARLYRLWNDGVPLEGEASLATWEERRAAILRFWDTRTENDWGLAVRRAVEAFVHGEVMPSEHPFTAAEREVFEIKRQSNFPFPFERAPAGDGGLLDPVEDGPPTGDAPRPAPGP
jgi:hypothetical protein